MRPIDVAVIAVYCAAVIAAGLLLAGRQRDASDYFLGHRGLPWWAIMLSIVATETSAITVISFPGIGARTNLTWLRHLRVSGRPDRGRRAPPPRLFRRHPG